MCASHTEQTHTRWLLGHRQSPSLGLLSCLLSLCAPLLSPCLEKKLTEFQPRQGSHDTEQVLGLGTQTLRFPSDFQNSVWGFSEEMVALKRQTEFLARKAFSRHWMTEWGSRVLEGSASYCRQARSWAGHRTALSTVIKCWDLEDAFPTSFLIFVPTEVTPQSGTIKASDICVQRKLPGLETLFSPSLLKVQKLKSEFSPVWYQPQGRGSERKHLWKRVCSWESKRERERDTEWLG